jgi:chromosome segregation ATPase
MQDQDSGDIIFDTASGLSVEEQKDIIKQIDQITHSSGSETVLRQVNASKKGYVFPLLVNAAALVLVLLGMFFAFIFRNVAFTRHFNAIQELNSAEGKLIQEIRRQAAVQIGEKELEIAGISDKITEKVEERENISAQLGMQPEREEELRPRIDEIDAEITALRELLTQRQNERRELVVLSRNQEAVVFNRYTSGDEAAALEELRNLNTEEERYAFFERQVSGYYQNIEIEVKQGKIDAAQKTLNELRTFISNSSFQNIRLVQAQRSLNYAAAGALAKVIELVTGDAFLKAERSWLAEKAERDRAIASLKWQNEKLQKEIAFLQPDVQYAELRKRDSELESLKANIAENEKQIAQRDAVIANHEAAITDLQQTLTQRDETILQRDTLISELKAQLGTLTQTLADRDRTIREYKTEIENQRAALADRDSTIAAMREQSAKDQQTIIDRERTIAELRTESANQRQTIAERDRTISQNRTQITIQQQQINERDRNIAELRTQASNQQQTAREMEQVLEELRTQTTGGHQAVTDRERLIAELRTQIASKEQVIAERDGSIASLNTKNTALSQTITERDRTISQLRIQVQNQQQTIAERDKSIQLLMTELNH